MTKDYMNNLLNANVRVDGRKKDELRDFEVETGVSKTAEGSARVKLGDTEVIAGVKLMIGAPYPDTPDQGAIMMNAELLPLSNNDFEPGPPGMYAIELARVVDRGIRESNAIDVKQLVVTKGEKCWIVSVDICSINDQGNLFDASALATIAALKDARFPEFDGEAVNYKKKTDKTIPFNDIPVQVTVVKIGEHLFVDPNLEEWDHLDARLTVAFMPGGEICSVQKGGEGTLSVDDISAMVDLAFEKSKDFRAKIDAL